MAYFKYTDNSPSKSHHEYIFMPTSSKKIITNRSKISFKDINNV